jgi:hypothetical protein
VEKDDFRGCLEDKTLKYWENWDLRGFLVRHGE